MSAQTSAPVKPPQPTDYFDVRSLLTEDERMIQDVVARFVDERVKPIIVQAFDDHRFPIELVPEMADLGLLGCYFDDYGCAGLNNVSYGLICQELDKGDAGIRSFVSVQTSLVMYPIHAYGSEAQKQRWLPAMARGEAIGCFGLTEAGGGSDPGSNRTRAVRDGGDWVINGSKMWITNGSIADVAVVWADTDEGVRGFLVEKGTPGYAARDIERTYSLRAVVTSELYFDNVRVPDENVLPGARSLGAPLSCLTQARFGIAWGAVGMATACFEEVLEYTRMRVLFGRPLSHTQTIQRRLADMCRRITTAQLLALQLGRLKDQHLAHHSQVSMAKWNNVRMALDVARDARDMLGAAGISLEFSAIRHMLNYETVITYEGTETVHQLVVGRELTGHNAF
jgi:glutaryl-CoA dehydrogenase